MARTEEICSTGRSAFPPWLLPFGAVMTVLLAVCILLLSISRVDEVKLAEAAGSIRSAFGIVGGGAVPARSEKAGDASTVMEFEQAVQLLRLKSRLETLLKNRSDPGALEVLAVDEGFLVRLGHEVLFAGEGATLRPEAVAVLKEMGAMFAGVPNVVRIEGHTSDRAPEPGSPFADNWVLSAVEAATVANFLVTEGKLDPARLVVRAMGQQTPREPNESREARARNWRVEILLSREVRSAPAPVAPAVPPAADGGAAARTPAPQTAH